MVVANGEIRRTSAKAYEGMSLRELVHAAAELRERSKALYADLAALEAQLRRHLEPDSPGGAAGPR